MLMQKSSFSHFGRAVIVLSVSIFTIYPTHIYIFVPVFLLLHLILIFCDYFYIYIIRIGVTSVLLVHTFLSSCRNSFWGDYSLAYSGYTTINCAAITVYNIY